eukprot:6334496-Pyramimonas_sp.AAC.2
MFTKPPCDKNVTPVRPFVVILLRCGGSTLAGRHAKRSSLYGMRSAHYGVQIIRFGGESSERGACKSRGLEGV